MLFITLMLASAILVNRILDFHGIFEPGGILVFPLTYFFGDIIAEVYGYKISRHILWCGLFCQFIFALLIYFVLKLPVSPFFHSDSAFHVLLSHLPEYALTFTIGTIAGGFLNIYLVSKFKILCLGKYFWIRSLTSTGFGEALFTIITLSPILLMHNSLSHVIQILISAYIFKLCYGFVFIVPASLLTYFLKRSEQIDVYDYGTNFNPFILSAN